MQPRRAEALAGLHRELLRRRVLREVLDADGRTPSEGFPVSGDETTVPFITTTTYAVWMRLPGQDWRPYADGFIEHHHAVEERERVERGIAQHIISPREARVLRKTTILDWVDA